jgi:hypothetical protein
MKKTHCCTEDCLYQSSTLPFVVIYYPIACSHFRMLIPHSINRCRINQSSSRSGNGWRYDRLHSGLGKSGSGASSECTSVSSDPETGEKESSQPGFINKISGIEL